MDATKSIGTVVAMAAVLLFAAVSTGCATAGDVPSADTMPEGASYSGLWYSDQFEHMYLYQDGDRVEGVYVYGGGGTVEGEVDGNLLLFSWDEPGARDAAQEGMSGQGFFLLERRGEELELVGQWGYNDNRSGAGPWEAEFVRELEEDDPETIEELREVH